MKTSLGLDEAGRGAVIGPLCIGAVLIKSKKRKKLMKIGVKDSKLLSPKRREKLAAQIEKIALDKAVLKLSASKLNELMGRKNLNEIEAASMASLINSLRPARALADSPHPKVEKFKELLKRRLKVESVVKAAHRAEKKWPEVAASSILAKVERDLAIKKLESEIGKPIGNGYPSDEQTIQFLRSLVKKKKLPNFVRKKWLTMKRIKDEELQRSLSAFLSKF